MNLVIFDIDGTLTATNEVDNRCYEETFGRMFGQKVRPRDWHGLKHVTDSGILEGLLQNLRGKGPTQVETEAFKKSFLEKLSLAFALEPDAFARIPGAGEAIRKLKSNPDWDPALATGGWRESALFKLQAAEIDIKGIPLATADDAVSRTAILQKALDRALRINSRTGYDKIVSVGDGRWDVEAAQKLGFAFIGIGRVEKLKEWGAPQARADMGDGKGFMELLDKAGPL